MYVLYKGYVCIRGTNLINENTHINYKGVVHGFKLCQVSGVGEHLRNKLYLVVGEHNCILKISRSKETKFKSLLK